MLEFWSSDEREASPPNDDDGIIQFLVGEDDEGDEKNVEDERDEDGRGDAEFTGVADSSKASDDGAQVTEKGGKRLEH